MDKNKASDTHIYKQVPAPALKEGEDFYINDKGFLVFTETYHLRRGYCCENGCLHCPYDFKNKKSK
jgi:hypothetical protein